MMVQRAAIENLGLWMPAFKFSGTCLILGGIVMALRIIIDKLKGAGEEVLSNLPADKQLKLHVPPLFATMTPLVMLMNIVFQLRQPF